MLTINEYKEKHKLTNRELGALIGVARESISRYLAGHSCVRNSEVVHSKMKELGIIPPGMTKEEYRKRTELKGPMTIQEYYERSGMTVDQIAEMLGVPRSNVHGWLVKGRAARPEFAERMKKFGIIHPVFVRHDKSKPKEVKNTNKGDSKGKILKPFQIYAVKKFGNTIVTSLYGKEKVIEEFAALGIKVSCREFETYDYGMHYIVESI